MASDGPDCSAEVGAPQRNSPGPGGARRGRPSAAGPTTGNEISTWRAQPGPGGSRGDGVPLPLLLRQSPANPTGGLKNFPHGPWSIGPAGKPGAARPGPQKGGTGPV